MPPCTDAELSLSAAARHLYQAPWYRAIRLTLVPLLAIGLMWRREPGPLDAVALISLQLVILWLPELVDRFAERRAPLAQLRDGRLRLYLEQTYEIELGEIESIEVRAGAWRAPRIIFVGADGETRITTQINHAPLLRFVGRLRDELAARSEAAGG